jgi:death on curing protein
MMKLINVTIKELLLMNHLLCRQQNKSQGVRNPGLLKAALLRPASLYQGTALYADIPSKAAAMAELIIKGKPFLAANMSTGLAAGVRLLEKNDCRFTNDVIHWELVRSLVKDPLFDTDSLADWYRRHLNNTHH